MSANYLEQLYQSANLLAHLSQYGSPNNSKNLYINLNKLTYNQLICGPASSSFFFSQLTARAYIKT